MRWHLSKVTAAIWPALGLLGLLAGVWSLSGGWYGSRSTGDLFLLAVSVSAMIGGVAAWSGRRFGRYVLIGVAVLAALYCIAFQLMVSAEFGWIWFAFTLLLLMFSILTFWSQARARQALTDSGGEEAG